jgi:hypothetical protein
MEGNQRINSSLKENSPGPREITIMIMGSIGRIRSFTISRRILLWSSIFLSFYILLSLFIISRYISIRSRFREQSVTIEEIKEKYEVMEKDLLKAQQRAVNLEAYIESTRNQKGEDNTVPGQGQAPAALASTAVDASGKGSVQTKLSVDIEGLDIRRLNSAVAIDFRLVNITSGPGAVEGYLHVIVRDKNGNFPLKWNEPSKEVRNGFPAEFRRGEHFIIQRFKQYHREFTSDGSVGMPAHIKILAYDPSGNLILIKEYEVNDV